jgi:hypothetical protein
MVIKGHTVKAGIHYPLFIPPFADICDLLRIGAEVSIKLVTEL